MKDLHQCPINLLVQGDQQISFGSEGRIQRALSHLNREKALWPQAGWFYSLPFLQPADFLFYFEYDQRNFQRINGDTEKGREEIVGKV